MRETIDTFRTTVPGAPTGLPRSNPALGRVLLALLVGLPALAPAGCGEPGEDAAPESFSSVASALTATAETTSPDPVGAVYVSSNKYGGNEIVSFLRFADGSLKTGPRVLTGGLGSGPGQLSPTIPWGRNPR